MSPLTKRSLLWLPGPLLAVLLVGYTTTGHGGPGFFFLSLFAGFGFMVLAPLVQLALLATPRFRGRYGSACVVGLFAVLALMVALAATGHFSFW